MKIRGLAKRFLTALAVLTLTAEGLAAPLSIRAAEPLGVAPAPLRSEPLDASAATGGYSQIVLPGQGVPPAKPTVEEEIISQRDAFNAVFADKQILVRSSPTLL